MSRSSFHGISMHRSGDEDRDEEDEEQDDEYNINPSGNSRDECISNPKLFQNSDIIFRNNITNTDEKSEYERYHKSQKYQAEIACFGRPDADLPWEDRS